MSEKPQFDSLERGHVVLAPDSFHSDEDRTRPWVIVNTDHHPFHGEQYVGMALTTRTWHDDRIPLDEPAFRDRRPPRTSSILPHAVVSLQPDEMTDYVCRVSDSPIDRAVRDLIGYLR